MPPVDLLPFLMYIPERWASWKKLVNNVKISHETMYERLLRVVETRMKKGFGFNVFMEEAIQNANEWGLDRRDFLT